MGRAIRKDVGTQLKENNITFNDKIIYLTDCNAAIQGFDKYTDFHMVIPGEASMFLGLNPERMMITCRVTCSAGKTKKILSGNFVSIELLSLCEKIKGDGGECYIPIRCIIGNQ